MVSAVNPSGAMFLICVELFKEIKTLKENDTSRQLARRVSKLEKKWNDRIEREWR